MSDSTSGALLIVDDEAGVRSALKRLMRAEGYAIHCAENAEAAADILASSAIDVILCDQDMPGKSGTEFLRDAAARFPHQRRLMLSGRFRSDDVAAAMDTGAVHKFVMKPWDNAILKADVRELFRQLMSNMQRDEHLDQLGSARNSKEATQDLSWTTFAMNRQLIRELHTAANSGSLTLQYQPQIDLRSNEVCGLEALLRWHSSIGPVSPDRFISLAERGGSITKLTKWVINEVCYRARGWGERHSALRVGLNVSPIDLREHSLVQYLESAIETHGISAAAIQVEVTESHALGAGGQAIAVLEALAAIGVTLAIDDFGAGATSVSYLANLPFTTVKLDRALTLQLETSKGLTVMRKIIEMCADLGMKTTIEGVETQHQLDIVRELGGDVVQGYFYSAPRSVEQIGDWLQGGAKGLPK